MTGQSFSAMPEYPMISGAIEDEGYSPGGSIPTRAVFPYRAELGNLMPLLLFLLPCGQ